MPTVSLQGTHPSKLTTAVAYAVYYRMKYHDCNPDVGMGPFPETILDDTLNDLEIQKLEVDRVWILNAVKTMRSY